MKVLLINPPAINTIPEQKDHTGKTYIESDDFGYFPPLGLLYIITYLEKHSCGHQLFFKDCVAEKISYKKLSQIILEIKPEIIGLTSFTLGLIDIIKTCTLIKSLLPHSHICLGGHHTIAFPKEAAMIPYIDSIIVGEGEIAFTELVQRLSQKQDITDILGVYTKESIKKQRKLPYSDKRFLSNMDIPPAYIDDINILPAPNRKYIQHINYHSIVGAHPKLATIITSRGCPYQCTFCDVPYKRYRERSVENIVNEIEDCLGLGYKEIYFYDDLFNITPERVIAICDEIDRRKLRFVWNFRGRINTVTKESLLRAKRSGCRMISFGVETGSNEGLAFLNKGVTVKQIKIVFNWCQELKIKTIADFMLGLPFERNRKDIIDHIDFVIKLNPDYIQFAILALFPNTPIYIQAIEKGVIEKNHWEKFIKEPNNSFTLSHWEEFFTTAELVEIQKYAYKKFYFNIRYILKSIFALRTPYELITKLKGVCKIIW